MDGHGLDKLSVKFYSINLRINEKKHNQSIHHKMDFVRILRGVMSIHTIFCLHTTSATAVNFYLFLGWPYFLRVTHNATHIV